jgi:hypothetical protein
MLAWQQSWMNCAALAAPSASIGPLLPMRPMARPSNLGVAAYRVRAVERLEIEEIGIVDDAGDDLAHVVRLAVIARHDAGQLLGRIARLVEGLLLARRELLVPRKLGHDFARDADAVGIVLGQVFA